MMVDGLLLISQLVLIMFWYSTRVVVSCGQWISGRSLTWGNVSSAILFLVLLSASMRIPWGVLWEQCKERIKTWHMEIWMKEDPLGGSQFITDQQSPHSPHNVLCYWGGEDKEFNDVLSPLTTSLLILWNIRPIAALTKGLTTMSHSILLRKTAINLRTNYTTKPSYFPTSENGRNDCHAKEAS